MADPIGLFYATFSARDLKLQMSRIIEKKVGPIKTDSQLRDRLHHELWTILKPYMPFDSGALRDNLQGVTSNKKAKYKDLRFGNSRINSKGIALDSISEYTNKKGDTSTRHYAAAALNAQKDQRFLIALDSVKSGRGEAWQELLAVAEPIIAEKVRKN